MDFSKLTNFARILQPIYILLRMGWLAAITLLLLFGYAFLATLPSDQIPDSLKPATDYYNQTVGSRINLLSYFPWALLAVIAFLIYSLRKQIDKAKRNKRHSELIASSFRIYSQRFHLTHDKLLEAIEQSILNKTGFAFDIKPHLQQLCCDAAELLKELCGKNCHCTIKLKSPDDDKLVTLVRDTLVANADRGIIDTVRVRYSYTQDTGFKTILDDPRSAYFFSNNLRKISLSGHYNNGNDGWNARYNSTIIVPITREMHSEKINATSALGFLTADSLAGEFQKEVAVEVMRFFAWHAFVLLDILGRLDKKSAREQPREVGSGE